MREASADDAILRRLKKILALAEGGSDGERETAQAHLATLLRRHGLSIEDLAETDGAEAKFVEFRVVNRFEHRLLRQVVAMVTNAVEVPTYSVEDCPDRIAVRLKSGHSAQVKFAFAVTREALARELDCTFSAFVQVNGLFPTEAPPDQVTTRSPEETRELVRLAKRMGTIDPTPIRRAID
ncbi:DUF2786 domain-containing protein [Rhodanobacter sp. FW106-PBR-LB-2-11]|uniref:DUF2786 domain-containing protein n=1 Tax=Rhodanobacter sp. FW106-PBR-LB-2-11 TaxID=1524463 RepID=UPI0034E60820